MKKRAEETANAEIARVPTRRSIAIRVNVTPSRDPEPEIFVAEADRQTRDPWDLTDDEKRQVLVCSRSLIGSLFRASLSTFSPLVRRWLYYYFILFYFIFCKSECNRSGTTANRKNDGSGTREFYENVHIAVSSFKLLRLFCRLYPLVDTRVTLYHFAAT